MARIEHHFFAKRLWHFVTYKKVYQMQDQTVKKTHAVPETYSFGITARQVSRFALSNHVSASVHGADFAWLQDT